MAQDNKPTRCSSCQQEVGPDHWRWQQDSRYREGGKWRCVVRKRASNARGRQKVKEDPVRHERLLQYHREYAKKHQFLARYKAYRTFDRQRGEATIPFELAKTLMASACHYCDLEISGGLDRMDNSRGHVYENVVPCCEQCNFILCDLPNQAKEILSKGLKEVRSRNLLENWVIPTKRRKDAQHSCQRQESP